MQLMLRALIASFAAFALLHSSGSVNAQIVKQVRLTEKHIQGFIAAQKDMEALSSKMGEVLSDKPDPKIQAEIEAIAKRHGFANFVEYDDVAANISMIMAGIDPETKKFTEPAVAIKKEIEEVAVDNTLSPAEKKQLLEELNDALKTAVPTQYPSNIELVTKYYDRIEAVLN